LKYIFFILIFFGLKSYAVTQPPQMLRACINNSDAIVTVKWNAVTDVCGSFNKYELYGSENGGPFNLIDIIPVLAVTEYPHQLVVLDTRWRYYLQVHTACDGATLLNSDTISIDVTYPENIQLDSVSYDLNSQDIIAGWTQNPSPDTKEYEIYNFITGDGASIGKTTLTNYNVSPNPASVFPIVVATLDSCNLSSLISEPHTVSFLNSSFDTCSRTATLTWSLYKGWSSIEKQEVFLSINGSSFSKLADLNSSTTTYVHSGVSLGDLLVFYIRSFSTKDLKTISSSTNKSIINTRAFDVPSTLYIELVTVNNNNTISIDWLCNDCNDVFEFEVLKSEDGVNFQTFTNTKSIYPTTGYSELDLSVSPNVSSYTYKIVAKDKCGDNLLESNISQSILLSLKPTITHTSYIGWDVGVSYYSLEKLTSSSTWNEMSRSSFPFNTTSFEDSVGCYRITAKEVINQFSTVALSRSNVICLYNSLQVYVPTAINPTTENNKFLVQGTGIDHTKSRYSIYTRWGEKIADLPTNEPYYFYYQNEQVPAGTYVYTINLFGLLGEKKTEKGVIHVIK